MTAAMLRRFGEGAMVLDLGCDRGSFPAALCPGRVVRCDLAARGGGDGEWVRADAAELPFAAGAFDLVVASHSLEHFDRAGEAILEMGRVLKPGGGLFVAVPDGSTLADRLYRWVARGGGHVNQFRNGEALGAAIARATGLPLTAMRTLHSGFTFLHPGNAVGRLPGRALLLTGGSEAVLRAVTWCLRTIDRAMGTRLGVYGWAFCFGSLEADFETGTNVCIRCGSVRVERPPGMTYACAQCGCRNWWSG